MKEKNIQSRFIQCLSLFINKMERWILISLVAMLIPAWASANGNVSETEKDNNQSDSIDREAPDFVTVSMLVAEPSDVLYSCVGHCALRLECPTFNLDYIFSYEGDNLEEEKFKFLLGKLKMGLLAVPTEEYLVFYRKSKRGVKQYKLNLPPQAELRLWQQMDERVNQGADLPFDYVARGCAHSTLQFITEALDTIPIEYGPWDEVFIRQTLRDQFSSDSIFQHAPWSRWCLDLLTGTIADKEQTPLDKLVRPADLRDAWLRAKIQGHSLMENEGKVLVESGIQYDSVWLTPMLVACMILLLVVISLFLKTNVIDYGVLAIQTLLAVFVVYMVFFSQMPNNEWNWLVIPFTPLPLITWKWRKHLNPLWGVIDLLWVIIMLLYPHNLTDNANLVLVLAIAIMFLKNKLPFAQHRF